MPGDTEFNISDAMDQIVDSGEVKLGEEPTPPAPAPAPSPAPAPAPAAPAAPAPAPATTSQAPATPPAPEPPPAPRSYPKTWKPEHAPLWDGVPDAIKDEVARREENFLRGIEQYKTHAEYGQRYNRVLEPYLPILQQYNVDPDLMMGNLLQTQMKLALGSPQDRVAIVKQIMEDYKITAAELIADAPEPGDPRLDALKQELDTVKTHLTQQQQRELQQRQEQIKAQVQAFASDPKNDLFEQVVDDIALLVRANPKLTLEAAYQQAIWANPNTRAILLQRQAEADAKARAEAERKHAEEAAAAAQGSVRSPARSGSVTAPTGSMDDTMREVLRNMKNRS